MTRSWFLLAALLASCGAPPLPRELAFTSLDGQACRPFDVPAGAVHVLVFVSHDCPIANSYAPELGSLSRDFARDGVRLFVVHVAPDLTEAKAREHQREYLLPDPVLLDPRQVLAKAVGAKVTPEAAVIQGGEVRYLGRIDDVWGELGARRTAASKQDLRQAVADLRAGRPVSVPRTEAIGCLLPEPLR